MLVLYVIAAILSLLFLLLLIPLGVGIRYQSENKEAFQITISYLFIKRKLLNGEEEENEAKEEESEEKPTEEGLFAKWSKLLHEKGLHAILSFCKEMSKLVGRATKGIGKRVQIKRFSVYLCIGGEDPADTAIRYGNTCAVVYPALAFLFSHTCCKDKLILVDVDFTRQKDWIDFDSYFSIKPLFLAVYGMRFLAKTISAYTKLKRAPRLKGTRAEAVDSNS